MWLFCYEFTHYQWEWKIMNRKIVVYKTKIGKRYFHGI